MKNSIVFVVVFALISIVCTNSHADSNQLTVPVATEASKSDSVDDVKNNRIEIRTHHGGKPSIEAYMQKSFSDNVVVSVDMFKTHGWDELTIGPAYYITPEMVVGVGVGIAYYASWESNNKSSHLMYSAFWSWETDTVESEVTVEYYYSYPKSWHYSAYLQTPITENFSAGFFIEKAIGFGPRLSWSVNKTVNLWVTPIIKKDGESNISLIAGVQFLF